MEEGPDLSWETDALLSWPGLHNEANPGRGRKAAKIEVLGKDSTSIPDGKGSGTILDEPVLKTTGKDKNGKSPPGHVNSFHADHKLVSPLR